MSKSTATEKNSNGSKLKELRDRLTHELELIAYGCNKNVTAQLEEFFCKELGVHSYMFYEYFFMDPLPREENIQSVAIQQIPDFEDNGKKRRICAFVENEDVANSYKTLCPFVKRFAKGMPLLPCSSEIKEGAVITDRRLRDTEGLKLFYKPLTISVEQKSKTLIAQAVQKWRAGKKLAPDDQNANGIKLYAKAHKEPGHKREFALIGGPWYEYLIKAKSAAVNSKDRKKDKEKKIKFIYVPIASGDYMYGQLLVVLPAEQVNKEKQNSIQKKLESIATLNYLPLMIVFRENIFEIFVKKGHIPKSWWVHFYPLSKGANGHGKQHVLEREFQEAWKKRASLEEVAVKEQHLILAEYYVASPGMIENLTEAITIDISGDKGEEIPCVLIYGGPGSGKEKMAQLVCRFSEDFRDAEQVTINMAALRPAMAGVPLLLGVNLANSSLGETVGLIQQAVDLYDKVVFIFDELNSLPYDVQGALLRFIEQRELAPVGTVGSMDQFRIPKEKRVLVIGIVNEDPDLLTKDSHQRHLKGCQALGGVLSDLITTFHQNTRTFRSDLYFRMKRNGFIRIPELRYRREDIPYLFYIFLNKELRTKDPNGHKTIMEYEAYDEIMNEGITWDGNVRQLQAVAKYCVRQIYRYIDIEDNKPIIVHKHLIREALEAVIGKEN